MQIIHQSHVSDTFIRPHVVVGDVRPWVVASDVHPCVVLGGQPVALDDHNQTTETNTPSDMCVCRSLSHISPEHMDPAQPDEHTLAGRGSMSIFLNLRVSRYVRERDQTHGVGRVAVRSLLLGPIGTGALLVAWTIGPLASILHQYL